ncbi:39690_t:CDS:2, partial [Gigaspora margarita]
MNDTSVLPTPVVSDSPLKHLQVDLVDLLLYAEYNDGYSYFLMLIDVFLLYVWAIPLKDKEESTIYSELINIFKNFGPSTKLQADNRSEFITSILKNTCNAFKIKLVHNHTRYSQSQEKIKRFNQTLEPHEAHKKLPYEAFFGFKMHAVYNILENIIPKNVALEDITPDNIEPKDIVLKNILKEITPAATQNNYNQALYEFYIIQVKCVYEKVVQNDKTYQNKLVIHRSVHR